jgi:hypothetical protein
MKKMTLADIAQTIVGPAEMTLEGVAIAASRALELQLAKGWYEDCVCGFNNNGELRALWLGTKPADDLVDNFPDYGFWTTHRIATKDCLLEVWAGSWSVLLGGLTGDGVFKPVFETAIEPRHA